MASSTSKPKGGSTAWVWERETAGIPELPDSIKARQVLYLRLVTHTMGPPGSTNHWTFFLINSDAKDAESSVHFNFRLGAPGEDDVMVVAPRQYVDSNSGLRSWDFLSAGQPTVQVFLQSILLGKQYHYSLNGAGTGCREWVLWTIDEFQRRNLISRADVETSLTLSQIIPFEYTKKAAPKPCPMDRGQWRFPELSRRAPTGFTRLSVGRYQQDADTLLVFVQDQWVKVGAADFLVDTTKGRITIPKLKLYIDYQTQEVS